MKRSMTAVMLCTAFVFGPVPVMASHHFESVQAIKIPSLNQLDNYVFQSSRPDATAFVMTVNNSPKAGPGGTFNKTAMYNIHIAEDEHFQKGYTYSFQFDDAGHYVVYQLNEPNGAVGAKGIELGKGSAGETLKLANGIQIWTGVAKDPFFGNSPGLHVFRKELSEGKYDPDVWKKSQGNNIFANRNCGAIVVDIPNKMLGDKVNVFMTTAVDMNNAWQQVQYSAIPLFSHSMLFENDALKREHDESRPDKSMDMKDFVSARTARASALAHSQKNPVEYGDKVANMLVPDVISYNVGTPAKFSVEGINGRKMSDDAMSTILSLLIGQPTDQVIKDQKIYSPAFPYVIPVTLK
ncbi:TPA: DUF4331 domain-containing protein [Enterobacter hormaechei subsp. steigerwaltii]|nr:DUF4331 domain-containing protein [Enterobacter hormaechei subsp. steigerwaltii]